jgi:hypothetical protein
VRAHAEGGLVEAWIGPDGRKKFIGGVDDLRVPFDPRYVNPPELDPSPARSGDYASFLSGREVAAEGHVIGSDDLGGQVSGELKDEVTRLFHRLRPATSKDDGWIPDEGIQGTLGSLSDVHRLASAEGLLNFQVLRPSSPDDDYVGKSLRGRRMTWFGLPRRVAFLDVPCQPGMTGRSIPLTDRLRRDDTGKGETDIGADGTWITDPLGRRPGGPRSLVLRAELPWWGA